MRGQQHQDETERHPDRRDQVGARRADETIPHHATSTAVESSVADASERRLKPHAAGPSRSWRRRNERGRVTPLGVRCMRPAPHNVEAVT